MQVSPWIPDLRKINFGSIDTNKAEKRKKRYMTTLLATQKVSPIDSQKTRYARTLLAIPRKKVIVRLSAPNMACHAANASTLLRIHAQSVARSA